MNDINDTTGSAPSSIRALKDFLYGTPDDYFDMSDAEFIERLHELGLDPVRVRESARRILRNARAKANVSEKEEQNRSNEPDEGNGSGSLDRELECCSFLEDTIAPTFISEELGATTNKRGNVCN